MDGKELKEIILCGENSKVQFKKDINNAVQIAQEIAAFANTMGGIILIGVMIKMVKLLTFLFRIFSESIIYCRLQPTIMLNRRLL